MSRQVALQNKVQNVCVRPVRSVQELELLRVWSENGIVLSLKRFMVRLGLSDKH